MRVSTKDLSLQFYDIFSPSLFAILIFSTFWKFHLTNIKSPGSILFYFFLWYFPFPSGHTVTWVFA